MGNIAVEDIARVCHETNRAWCAVNGDDSQLPWEQAEEWQHQSSIDSVNFAIAHPDALDDALHNIWSQDRRDKGWVYGEVKDNEAKTNPCLVPFEQLPDFQQKKDKLFLAVVRILAGKV